MASNVPKRVSSLLDALDQSFLPSIDTGITNGLPPAATSLRRNLVQTPLNNYLGQAPGSSKRIVTLEDLRTAQRLQGTSGPDPAADTHRLLFGPSGKAGNSGFNLNYDNETPVRPIDIGGPDQEQKLADFVTKSIEDTGQGISVKGARDKLGLRDARDLIPGLEVRLLNHQAIGVAWMLEKEKGPDKGGILADDMGLGKTVQMIATMTMNMPGIDDDCRTTLVVVPAALLQQWKDEIDTKTNGIFRVHVHHGKDKLKTKSQVNSKDVIVTSYQTLCQDFMIPKNLNPTEEEEWLEEKGGLLSQVKFFRAVADEAQFIRNRATRASITLAHVRARYRWLLTGTPVTNSLADIYGLLRFGRFRPWNDWNDFNEHVARVQSEDAPLAGSRAQAILKPILLRRTKNGKLEGEPLLQLPPKTIEIVKLQFSPEERDIYDSFEKETEIRLNRFIREGTLVKNHAAVLVMILRLRQLCCHPQLILSLAGDYEDPTLLVGSDADKELGRAKKVMGSAWVAEVKQRFLVRAAAADMLSFDDECDEPAGTCPVCKDMFVNNSGRVLACGHEICFDCTLNLSNSPIVHNGIFGQGSEKENLAAEKEYETAVAKGYRPCPTCNKMMDLKSKDKIFKSSAFEPSEDELRYHARSKRAAKAEKDGWKGKGANKRSPSPALSIPDELEDSDEDLPDIAHMLDTPPKKRRKQDDDREDKMVVVEDSDSDVEVVEDSISQRKQRRSGGNTRESSPSTKDKGKGRAPAYGKAVGPSEAVLATWGRGDDDMEPSTKMIAMLDFLKEAEYKGDKTICYSQWTSMLDLIDTLFARHGIQTLRFDGTMDRLERDFTLATFKKPGGPKVILISTKCGSVGLNLVSANHIINMDLSWNYAAESQAYDRCHRIGQDKPVFVKRLVVEDTIEERMLLLQDVKTGLAEAALGEGTGAKLHKLSVKDIKYLFGISDRNGNDKNKNPAQSQSQ